MRQSHVRVHQLAPSASLFNPRLGRLLRLASSMALALAVVGGGCMDDTNLPAYHDSGVDGLGRLDLASSEANGCVGQGCACTTDDPCVLGADGTVCTDGTCQPGCNAAVGCSVGSCCNGVCIEGCCSEADCPPGQPCDAATGKCGSCDNNKDCGADGRCCGNTGDKTCVLGDCCDNTDCDPEVEHCIDNTCRRRCDVTTCAPGSTCCGDHCFVGDCCNSADCSDGKVCDDNRCSACTSTAQCGSGKVCLGGSCQTGCSGQSLCKASSICCGDSGQCEPGQPGCQGHCVEGSCCDDTDCSGIADRCAPDRTCRHQCTEQADCGTGNCCGGWCYADGCVDTIVRGPLGAPDAPFADAYINGVQYLALDKKNNVFFTEWMGGIVRVVNDGKANIGRVKPGQVGRLTGGTHGCKAGPVEQAEMRYPTGLAFSDDGTLYVADYHCRVIWKFSKDFSSVSILAGDPSAKVETKDGKGKEAHFYYPRGLVFGVDKKLYVSDYSGSAIRQVALDGTVKTVAGKAKARDSQDGAAVTTARFDYPRSLTMDRSGTLYVGEYGTGAVRKITNVTVGSDVAVATLQPYDLATKKNLPAFKRDPDPDPRRRYIKTYGTLHGQLVASGQSVYGIFYNRGLYEMTPRSGDRWNFNKVFTKSHLITPVMDSDQRFWLGGWVHGSDATASNTLQHYSPQDKKIIRSLGKPGRVGAAAGMNPSFHFATCDASLTITDNGHIWIADRCASRVRRVAPDGMVTNLGDGTHAQAAGGPTTARFAYPTALLADGNSVYGVNGGSSRNIFRIDDDNQVTLLGKYRPASEDGLHENGKSGLSPSPSYFGKLALDPNSGALYLATYTESGAGRSPAYKYKKGEEGCKAAEGCLTYWDGMPMIVKIPNRGTGDPVWYAGTRNRRGRRDSFGYCESGPLGAGRFGAYPRSLVIDKQGYLYVADNECGIRKVAPGGTINTLNKDIRGHALALDSNGTLYANHGDRIYKVDTISGKATIYAGGARTTAHHYGDGKLTEAVFWGPNSMATDKNNRLFILDNYNNAVRMIRK